MGKHSNRGINRVVFICLECAYLTGKDDTHMDKGARCYDSSCDICHRKKPVTDARAWNYFTPDQISMAKTKLRTLGLDRRTFANVDDVKKMVNIVHKVLGKEGKSDTTKEVLADIVDRLARGKPIEMYYAKQLTYCFTQDAAAMEKQEKPKRKKKVEDQHRDASA